MSELFPNNGDVNKVRVAIRELKLGDGFSNTILPTSVYLQFFPKYKNAPTLPPP